MIRTVLTIVCFAGLLAACQNLPQEGGESVPAASTDEVLSIKVLSDAEVVSGEGDYANAMDRRQFLADILFEGLQALDADRLLTPVDDSAYSRFQRVLAYEADNEIALQGLQDIAARYLELSMQASRRGLFEEAARMLENARFVDADHPDIPKVALALQEEMNSGDLFFSLQLNEVTNHTEQAEEKLADIARQAREHSANFLITAPNDAMARWMFNSMRVAVEGYRLRGNIEIASRTTVRLRMPHE